MKLFCFFAILVFTFPIFKAANAFIAADDEDGMMCHKYPEFSRVSSERELKLFHVDPERYAHTVYTQAACSGPHADIKEIPHSTAKQVDGPTEGLNKDEMAGTHKPKNAPATDVDTFPGKALKFGLKNVPNYMDRPVKNSASAHRILRYKNPESATFKDRKEN